MAGEFVRGKQLAAAEVTSRELAVGALSADATGRAIIASGYFDAATVTAKFAASSIGDSILTTPYIKADGTRAFSGNQDHGGFKITGLGTPTLSTDATTKAYVDSVAAGLDPKASSRAATTAALPSCTYSNGTAGVGATLTATANGALAAQDGVTLVASDRLLVKNQASGFQNGIYVVTQVGVGGSTPFILTRASDDDSSTSTPPRVSPGNFTFVEEGTTLGSTGWSMSAANPITMGTTALTWVQFSSAGVYNFRNGLSQSGANVDVVSSSGSLTSSAGTVDVTFAIPSVADDAGAASAGAAASAMRSDSKRQVSTGSPTVTVKSEVTAASTGTATTLLRSDAQIQVATAVPGAAADAATATQGTASSLLRSDAKLQVSTAVQSVTVKTDAASTTVGTATSLLRTDAQLTILTAVPTAAHVLSDAGSALQGTSTSSLRADATMTALTAAPSVVSNAGNTNAQGTSTSLARADHQHQGYYLTKQYRRIAAAVASGASVRVTAAGAGGDITTAKGVPSGQGFAIYVKANGIDYSVGDNTNTGVSFWFTASSGSGATPLAFSAVVNASFLWCNTTQLGFALDTSDFIDIIFESATI